jgi:hypothetical protein
MTAGYTKITDYPSELTHKDCGGVVHSVEAAFIFYEIVSDGVGGWDYTGNRVDTIPMEGMDHQFECRRCGTIGEHFSSEIVGTEVSIR